MGDLEPPEKANAAIDTTKEVTWSATPTEKEQEFIENCKVPARYNLSTHLSVKQVLKETFRRFKITDPTFLIVSKVDPESIFRKTEDFDKLTPNDVKRLFPAELIRLNTHFQLFMVSDRSIHRLKRDSFGYYEYARRHIWITEHPFKSADVRNIGFLLRRSADKTDRKKFAELMTSRLNDHKLSEEDEQLYNVAKTRLPFEGPTPMFELRTANNIRHTSAAGEVKTSAITIHCDKEYVAFLSKILTGFYESDKNAHEQFVPHSLLHGNDPVHQKAYRNAIILQNQYLTDMRILPVIGISPKALQEKVAVFDGPPQKVLTLLQQYKIFTSIDYTSKSDELGLMIFVTTSGNFDKAKEFVNESIPKIWAKLSNTFLSELPVSVQCPRLTTSNLKDASTCKTAAMLANAFQVPDDATVASKWSQAPQIHKPPTAAITVNYSDSNFPELKRTNKQRKEKTSKNTATTTTTSEPPATIENTSHHSKASASSAGTNFTKDDAMSLYTTLTESLMEDMKSQTEKLMGIITQDRTDHKEEQRLAREAQELQNQRTDARFEKLIQAFSQQATTNSPPSKKTSKATKTKATRKRNTDKRATVAPTPSPLNQTLPMDTAPDKTNLTDPEIRQMEDDEKSEVTYTVASYAQYNEVGSPESDLRSTKSAATNPTYQLSQISHETQLSRLHQKIQRANSNPIDPCGPDDGVEFAEESPDEADYADDEDDYDDEDEEDDEDDEDDDDEEEEDDEDDDDVDWIDGDAASSAASFKTVDSNDPTHEAYAQQENNAHDQAATQPPQVSSPPKVVREVTPAQSTQAPQKRPETIIEIQTRLYKSSPVAQTQPNPAPQPPEAVQQSPSMSTQTEATQASLPFSPETDRINPERDPMWTVKTESNRSASESQARFQHNMNKQTPPRSSVNQTNKNLKQKARVTRKRTPARLN
jgi:hypothetical protein